MPKNRVLHARITDDTHEKLTRVCNEIGCSITDYVTSVLDESFDQEPRDIESEPIPRTEGKIIKISYDNGETWNDIPELKNMRVVS